MANFFIAFVTTVLPVVVVHGSITCTTNEQCEIAYLQGSKCDLQTGLCTNPFYENGGCLKTILPSQKLQQHEDAVQEWQKVRVCHSDDPPGTLEAGLCRPSPLEYMEVRLLSQNWESPFFQTWILQILLSEVLDVPSSIETGVVGMSNDFYAPDSPLNYGTYHPLFEELEVSADVLDCRSVKTKDPEAYKACGHYVPEIWETEELQGALAEGTGPLRDVGALAKQGWFIPKFTAERDTSLTSYLGLQGEENRIKLAKRFKRPTTWNDYCNEVSSTSCATPDNVTSRAPIDEEEGDTYFVEGEYTGHFRATDANNCTLHATTCTGHFADYPCGWRSFNEQQQFHLGIALESSGPDEAGGYSYGKLVQIWKAANATKSDVMIMWWYPEAMYQAFIDTDAEFIPVVLPTTTQQCLQHRMPRDMRCDDDFDVAMTSDLGKCDYRVHGLSRLIGEGLREATYEPGIPEALHSPAFPTLENFRITTHEFGDIFAKWFGRGIDHWDFDPRFAVCEWVVENLDHLMGFVPDQYPRIIQESDEEGRGDPSTKNTITVDPLFLAGTIIASIATLVVAVTFVLMRLRKNTKIMFYAQIEFMSLLLGGLLLMGIGAIMLVVPPTDATCVAIVWLTNMGYAVYLPPLVARTFAINTALANSGKRMQRVRVSHKRLYGSVLVVAALVGFVLILWTTIDTPTKSFYYVVTDLKTQFEETIVVAADYCAAESSNIWMGINFGWQAALLLPASIISFSASRVRDDLNDTKPMSCVLLLHLMVLSGRAVVYYILEDSNKQSDMMAYMSILISADAIAAIVIYIFPKFVAASREQNNQDKLSSSTTEVEMLPDLCLNTTIMVTDVVGFSAWSSVREPVHVFKLLETLYETFDQVADKHKVFKVETVRDCYVAATGIPIPQKNHAEIMAKFAIEILKKMDHVSKKLEMMFGPDTGELALRTGIHSGPVTGGFLKGKGARFQLFGDTVTTACLLQSTGESNRIHISKETADLIAEAGRKRWVRKREEKVQTEEKGELETYWLTHKVKTIGGFEASTHYESSSFGMRSELESNEDADVMDSQDRWVEWNVELLSGVLKEILAQRATKPTESFRGLNLGRDSSMPLEEVAEIIELPEFNKRAAKRQRYNADMEVDPAVLSQLRDYVAQVAEMYQPNPFHNFAHASYVVMAVSKYMNRIMGASEVDLGFDEDRQRSSTQEALHDHTYGITSDPLTRFACLLSALIHDIDHPGVPNPQFITENERLAGVYKNRSVAEQNSFDLAWDLLMDDSFSKLRSTICEDASELRRFRQLVVNSVMATDLGDKELKELRNGRWDKAFADAVEAPQEDPRDARNRKATIVIEHLIQAADIAHTCQHWGIYRKWNERLFQECYIAYRQGRAETNPADGWYKGELGFYDFYIIPLAKKLRDCGVFGPTSDENLDYAKKNRSMWEKEGKSIVAAMLEKAEREYNVIEEVSENSSLEAARREATERELYIVPLKE